MKITKDILETYENKGFSVMAMSEEKEGVTVKLYEKSPSCSHCPNCNSLNIRKHSDSRTHIYRDKPFQGRKVKLSIARKCFRCIDCGHVFSVDNDLLFNRNLTATYKNYVVDTIKNSPHIRIV